MRLHPQGVAARSEFKHFLFVSWNTLRKGVGEVEEIVKGLKRHLGLAVFALQEVDYWRAGSGMSMHGFELIMSDSEEKYSDGGFLIRLAMRSSIRTIRFGDYWAGMFALDVIFISCHLLDHGVEHGRCRAVYHETAAWIQEVRSSFRRPHLSVIIGFDANTSLPKAYDDMTGFRVPRGLKSHTSQHQRVLMAWLGAMEVSVRNTFGAHAEDEELWTRGRKLDPDRRSQIDFVAATAGLQGTADVFKDQNEAPFCDSDHRAISGDFAVDFGLRGLASSVYIESNERKSKDSSGTDPRAEEAMKSPGTDPRTEEARMSPGTDPRTENDYEEAKEANCPGTDPRTEDSKEENPAKSMPGLEPVDEQNLELYKVSCANLAGRDLDLQSLAEKIFRIGKMVKHTTSAQRKNILQRCPDLGLKAARATLRGTCPGTEERKVASRTFRRIQRRSAWHKNKLALEALSRNSTHFRQAPLQMQVNGEMISDRLAWLEEATRFGETRFGDNESDEATQTFRMSPLAGATVGDRLGGRKPRPLSFFVSYRPRRR